MNGKLTILIEEDVYGFYAYCPQLKGCQSQGDTYDEAYSNITEAIELYLESIDLDKEPLILNKQLFSTTYEVALA